MTHNIQFERQGCSGLNNNRGFALYSNARVFVEGPIGECVLSMDSDDWILARELLLHFEEGFLPRARVTMHVDLDWRQSQRENLDQYSSTL